MTSSPEAPRPASWLRAEPEPAWRYWCTLEADLAALQVFVPWTPAVAVLCRRTDRDVTSLPLALETPSRVNLNVYLERQDYRRLVWVTGEVAALLPDLLESVRMRLALRLYLELRGRATAPAMDYLCQGPPAMALREALRCLAAARGWT